MGGMCKKMSFEWQHYKEIGKIYKKERKKIFVDPNFSQLYRGD